jgi:hypothetical protein
MPAPAGTSLDCLAGNSLSYKMLKSGSVKTDFDIFGPSQKLTTQ